MPELYPFRFLPVFRQYLWGGRRLQSELNKPIGSEGVYAESWEVVDHGDDQSIVADGQLAGKTLHELILAEPEGLLGGRVKAMIKDASLPASLRNRFPLLLKFLDANRDLSVQVHPSDSQAARLSPPDLGKTEAWIVMAAQPGSKIYAGLKSGVTRDSFAAAISNGRCEDLLHSFEPRAGDCVFIPAGTVHAIGAGLLVAEIQQSSDTTFRLYDWNRTDADGNPRELHIEQGLEVIDFESGPVNPVESHLNENGSLNLVDCEKFTIIQHSIDGTLRLSGNNSFQIFSVLEGSLKVEGDPTNAPLNRGETILIPACVGNVQIKSTEPTKLIQATM